MKRNDIRSLTEKSISELQTQLVALQTEADKVRLEKKAGKLENIRLSSSLGDDIARVKTVLRQKQVQQDSTV